MSVETQNTIEYSAEYLEDFENEAVEPTEVGGVLGELIEQYGGSPEDWNNDYPETRGMKLSGNEIVDAYSNMSITKQIRETCPPSEVAEQEKIISELKIKGQSFSEYNDGETKMVMVFTLESGGTIASETWSRQVREDEKVVGEAKDFEIVQEQVDQLPTAETTTSEEEYKFAAKVIDMNAFLASRSESETKEPKTEILESQERESIAEVISFPVEEPEPSMEELFESLTPHRTSPPTYIEEAADTESETFEKTIYQRKAA